ncbi:MAG: DnaB-like helicase C-terminal domain-containing protein [Bacillota bacterium]|nr:DnaB-like helicase C-terminal domain-containing protein [Bacillota bacterium]
MEAEQSVVGAMILDPRVIPQVAAKLKAEDFMNETCKIIFEAAVDISERGKAFDTVIAANIAEAKLGKDAARFVFELMEITPTSANAMDYAEIVHKNAGIRFLHDSIEELLVNDEPQDIAGNLIGMCREFLETERTDRIKTIADALTAMYVEKSASTAMIRIDTGMSRLDRILKGLCGGNLVVIAARPGVGKSALGIQIARAAAAKGNKTLICSLEMSPEEIAERLVARSGVDMDRLIDNDLELNDKQNMAHEVGTLEKLPILISDDPYTTVPKIRAMARSIQDLKLIVVDYLTLMQSHKKSDKRYLEIGAMTRDLKILAKELKIPIAVLSQLNREKDETEKPTLRDLRESGDIEQDADKVIMLWKLEYSDEGKPIKVGCTVEKNRRGKTGAVVLRFDGAHMIFTETEERYTPPKRKSRVFADDD